MSMHLYQLSGKLLGDTVGKVNDNLTSAVLAASAIALALGYLSKVLLRQSSQDTDLVSPCPKSNVRHALSVYSHHSLFTCVSSSRSTLHTSPPASPSWVMPLHLGKAPLNFLKMLMIK